MDTDSIEIVVPDGEAPEDSLVQFDAPQEGEGKPAGDGAEVPPPEDDAAKRSKKPRSRTRSGRFSARGAIPGFVLWRTCSGLNDPVPAGVLAA